MGGPLAAALGAALGHQFDRGLAGISGERVRLGDRERTQTAFFTATFAVMGHVAKADGRVNVDEIKMAEQLMRQMRLEDHQRDTAIKLFQNGKRPDFALDAVIDQLRHECHRRSTLLQMFLEIQIQAALADGRIASAERQVLLRIASGLGFSAVQFQQLLDLIEGMSAYERSSATHKPPPLADAYRTLGVSASASDADIKRAYRRLMNQHHPDKLVARGLPEEMIKLATEKTQEVRAAYEQVREARAVR